MNIHEILVRVKQSGSTLRIRSLGFIRLHPSDLSGLRDLRHGDVVEIAVGRTDDQTAEQVAAMIWRKSVDFAENPVHNPPPKPKAKPKAKASGSGGKGAKSAPANPEAKESAAEAEQGEAAEGDSNFDPSKPPEGDDGKK